MCMIIFVVNPNPRYVRGNRTTLRNLLIKNNGDRSFTNPFFSQEVTMSHLVRFLSLRLNYTNLVQSVNSKKLDCFSKKNSKCHQLQSNVAFLKLTSCTKLVKSDLSKQLLLLCTFSNYIKMYLDNRQTGYQNTKKPVLMNGLFGYPAALAEYLDT